MEKYKKRRKAKKKKKVGYTRTLYVYKYTAFSITERIVNPFLKRFLNFLGTMSSKGKLFSLIKLV